MRPDDASESSSDMDESFYLGGDEEIVLGEVDWELVQSNPRYAGRTDNELLLMLDNMDSVRVGNKSSTQRIWVRKPNDIHSATIHPVEKLPKRIVVSDSAAASNPLFNPDRLHNLLSQETDGNEDVLWTLLKLKYSFLSGTSASPSREGAGLHAGLSSLSLSDRQNDLMSENIGIPSEDGWRCLCGRVNTGFKATCESCRSPAPSGWWRQDPQLQQHMQSTPSGQEEVFKLKRPSAKSKVGWTLRNEDLYLLKVEVNSPAATAGLLPGVKLVSINGNRCLSVEDVQRELYHAGTSFDVTVSTEAMDKLTAAQYLGQDDGVVVVAFSKQPGQKMGTNWEAHDRLILRSVEPHTPAYNAGLQSLTGWKLTHINKSPVATADDIVREVKDESHLTLYWARATPGSQWQLPRSSGTSANAQLNLQQQLQAAQLGLFGNPVMPNLQHSVVMFAPSLLWVIAPDRVQHCGGLYRLQNDQINDHPYWKHEVQQLLLYSSTEGLWCISDSYETGNGWVFSMVPSNSAMPDSITDWEVMGETDREIRVVSQLPIPGTLNVTASSAKLEHIRGTYHLQRAQDDSSGLPFQVVNGMPVWRCAERERWLYSSRKGAWFITDDVQDFVRGGGCVSGKTGHGGNMPDNQKMWVTRDNVERPDLKVTIASTKGSDATESVTTQQSEPEQAKTNVTASVHENAVWKYEDIGRFNLASHISGSLAGNLLWVCPGSKQGWLGIDLSNEEARTQLVRTLTELIDQECITVRPPIVAGVGVRLLQQVILPNGELLEAGSKGQVLSVLMGRDPLGNAPPRMAKIDFIGCKTPVTVSYGQVEPLQGVFERNAKVRVLAVDAVAVVDSESSPAGVGVKGKYRVKYATGKTYHVRDFALINADKPWGGGDEVPEGAKIKEGDQVMVQENIVFASLSVVKSGTVGVVTHVSKANAVEVLAGGLLFVCRQNQLHKTNLLTKGALVSPLLEEMPNSTWRCGRVEEVRPDKKCVIRLPTGDTIDSSIKDIRVCHFALGQPVEVADLNEDFRSGVVERVLPSGIPLIRSGKRSLKKYWFIKAKYDTNIVPPTYSIHAPVYESNYADYSPLDLRQAEENQLRQRKALASQWLSGLIQLKHTELQLTEDLVREESVKNTVVLRKGCDEKMGTVFHHENMLILTRVIEGSAAERSGVGSFIGRELIGINNSPVSSTSAIVQHAAGKEAMMLHFKPSPVCPAGHSLHIVFNKSSNNTCPGCFKQYSEAFFACDRCWFDGCGACCTEMAQPAHQTVPEEPQKAFRPNGSHMPSASAAQLPSPTQSSASPAYAASLSSANDITRKPQTSYRYQNNAEQDTFFSWGQSAFNCDDDSAEPVGMSWGVSVQQSQEPIGHIGQRDHGSTQESQTHLGDGRDIEELSRNSIMSLLDSMDADADADASPGHGSKGDDGYGDIALSKLLNRVHELNASPSQPDSSLGLNNIDSAAFLANLTDTNSWAHTASDRRIY